MVRRRGPEAPPNQEIPMHEVNGVSGDRFEGFANQMRQALSGLIGTSLSNEVCGVCKNFGHGAHMCRSDLAREDVHWVNRSNPTPKVEASTSK